LKISFQALPSARHGRSGFRTQQLGGIFSLKEQLAILYPNSFRKLNQPPFLKRAQSSKYLAGQSHLRSLKTPDI